MWRKSLDIFGVNNKKASSKTGKKVFVGLSGGVDSAVSAALLKKAGYDVTGVFIKVWQPSANWRMPCTWRDERRDAMRVSIALNIPFIFVDLENEYKKGVVDKMVEEYKRGRTPNPDVLCNKEVKFGAFLKKAKELGADYIATGHYAQIQEVRSKEYELREGRDGEKDQSYFLWTLTQEDLANTLFPVGHLEKREVRMLAEKFNLPVASKKDSQGICFIGDVSMEEFLSHFISSKPGLVINTEGEVIGSHRGAVHYTIGERRGFEVNKKRPEDGAFYVVSKDIEQNTITVSNKQTEIISRSPKKIVIKNVNWINEPSGPNIFARIRYRGEKLPAELSLMGKKLAVEFKDRVRGLSLGQSIVFYEKAEKNGESSCLGGGIMDRVIT
jgi:tRNA-specific 2-thiouridylase